MIFQQDQFIDGDTGSLIFRRRAVRQGAAGNELEVLAGPIFHAIGTVQTRVVTGQMASLQFTIDVPGETVEEAFANLPDATKAAGEKAEAELKAQLLERTAARIAIPAKQLIIQ